MSAETVVAPETEEAGAQAGARSRRRDAFLVALTKLAASVFVLATGFRALSDDDYARTVIAQQFAVAPSLDPTGTSWLPFPFWLTGTVMAVAGPDLLVGRVLAFALGIGGAVLVFVAARWMGVERRGALLGACLAAVFPYSAWLGVAALPESWTAALVVLAAASTVSDVPGRKVLGAVAILVATLCRYETWPVAAGIAAFGAWDFLKHRRVSGAAAAALAVAGPLAWMLHGLAHHDDALFFVQRVADYRRAVGADTAGLLARIVGFPMRFVRFEPELVLALVLAVVAHQKLGAGAELRRFARPAALFVLMLVVLVVAESRGGAPTHHNERALLAAWLLGTLVLGQAIAAGHARFSVSSRRRWAAGLLAVALFGALAIRPFNRRDSFIDRAAEIDVGRAARTLAGPTERVAIVTDDFGFFAVRAGLARPGAAAVLDDHDPRKQRTDDMFTPERLGEELRSYGAGWLVLPRKRSAIAEKFGTVTFENERFLLVKIELPE